LYVEGRQALPDGSVCDRAEAEIHQIWRHASHHRVIARLRRGRFTSGDSQLTLGSQLEGGSVETYGRDPESSTILAMARKLRFASAQRDHVVRPIRDRYDRSERDPRLMPEKRAQIAAAFVRAAYQADHTYEDYLDRALGTQQEVDRG
jgi:hypothetical protein